MRGRLIFPMLAELYRLDSQSMATDYDPDFKEPRLIDVDLDGLAETYRREQLPVRVPCQVEPEAFESMRMTPAGNSPRSSLDLVFHFRDLERLGLSTVAPGDRLGGLFNTDGRLVNVIRTPPGLYATESRPIGYGLSRRRSTCNLLLVSFQDRPAARNLS